MATDSEGFKKAWDDIKSVFGLEGLPISKDECLLNETIQFLERHELLAEVADFLQAEIEARLRLEVVPEFWKFFDQPDDDQIRVSEKANLFCEAVSNLHSNVSKLQPFVARLNILTKSFSKSSYTAKYGLADFTEIFKVSLKGALHSQLPVTFEGPTKAFYSRALHVFHAKKKFAKRALNDSLDDDLDEDVGMLECRGCQRDSDQCECSAVISVFHDINQKLIEMDLLERLTSNVVTQIIHHHIKQHVHESCKGSFTVSHLGSLESWLDVVVMGWIKMLYAPVSTVRGSDTLVTYFRQQLLHYLFEVYTKVRINQLFNIMIEFPESQPALEDLKLCLARTDLRSHFVQSLKDLLRQKLLHLGVNTTDILTAYITAIRALRILDPTGVLLELVCEPVRKYLRSREDTVRCIVQSLIDDSSSELAEELLKNEGLSLDEAFSNDYGDVELDALEMNKSWKTWKPDPVDADPSRSERRRTSDVISMLVNIYGSKELFVNEYRTLLSNRLLSQFCYSTDKEIRNLEMLKLRFGESSLQQCEVMLKDISESKRINHYIHGEEEDGKNLLEGLPFIVNAMVLSGQFWPQFKDQDSLKLPQEVTDCLEEYSKAFETLKKIRTLVWKPHLGNVNIDLEIGDKKWSMTVSPVHAVIIYHFQTKEQWTAKELASTMEIPVSVLLRKISFWLTQGLIRERPQDVFTLVDEAPAHRMSSQGNVASEDDDTESLVRNASDQRAEELQVFWSYIVNMLINLGSLPLERIFQMLKMFAMQGPSAVECSISELQGFLDEKVRKHELTFSGGQYKLPKV